MFVEHRRPRKAVETADTLGRRSSSHLISGCAARLNKPQNVGFRCDTSCAQQRPANFWEAPIPLTLQCFWQSLVHRINRHQIWRMDQNVCRPDAKSVIVNSTYLYIWFLSLLSQSHHQPWAWFHKSHNCQNLERKGFSLALCISATGEKLVKYLCTWFSRSEKASLA